MTCLRFCSILVFIFLAPTQLAFAYSYYAADYDPLYLPYNFDDALSAYEDEGYCETALSEFDRVYQIFEINRAKYSKTTGEYGTYNTNSNDFEYVNDVRIEDYNDLEDASATMMRDCLADYRGYLENQEEIAAEAAAEKEERERRQRAEVELHEALDNCDFDYFENEMTTAQKMETYDERKACEDKTTETKQISVDEETVPVSVPTQSFYAPTPSTPVNYTPPQPTSVIESADTAEKQVDKETSDVLTSSTSTSTLEKITVTEEELNQMVQEKVQKALAQSEEVEEVSDTPKPSFFQRVINFFRGLF